MKRNIDLNRKVENYGYLQCFIDDVSATLLKVKGIYDAIVRKWYTENPPYRVCSMDGAILNAIVKCTMTRKFSDATVGEVADYVKSWANVA